MTYIGRFAPSPTGALHAGSLVAALASWLDARAHQGQWLLRIEDVDTPRCSTQAQHHIMRQLQQHALWPDAKPVLQSQRTALYTAALQQLALYQLAYPCTCSRKKIVAARMHAGQTPKRHAELVYPGSCRPVLHNSDKNINANHIHLRTAWRLHIAACLQRMGQAAPTVTHWHDRRLGAQQQCVSTEIGDFVLHRADGLWAYQLTVVVDDAQQGITHIVRGSDLADNTPRQIVLQQALGLPVPQYLHTPLIYTATGEKLSKQTGAAPLPEGGNATALVNLQMAAQALQLPQVKANTPEQALQQWIPIWATHWCKGASI